jgi:Legume lectin domain/Abnormal spindle-like microcephaly-assoc'd, ASPM-SPD-2-Hydin
VFLRLLIVSAVGPVRLLSILGIVLVAFCGLSIQPVAAGQQLIVSPGNLDFQTVAVGQQATLPFEIRNLGSAALRITSVASSKSEFRLVGATLPASLAPAETIRFLMTFEPTLTGKTSALLEVVSSAKAVQAYTLSGVGEEAFTTLQVSPSSLNFGNQKLSSLATRNVTVQNTGAIPLAISGVTVIGAGFDYAHVSPGLTIAPKQQAVLQVLFRPFSTSECSGKLTILSKNLAAPVTLPLAGGGASPVSSASPHSIVATSLSKPISTASATRTALVSSSAQPTVSLQWGASSSPVTGYRVYRGSAGGGPYPNYTVGPVSTLGYVDSSVSAGATYYYVVTAINAQGAESEFSNEVSVTVPGSTVPSPPVSSDPSSPSTPVPSSSSSLTTAATLNGSAVLIDGSTLRLTNTGTNQSGSGWFATPLNIQMFTTDFNFQIANPTTSPTGNGIAFVIQETGTEALGPAGGGLGYGPDAITNPSASSLTPIAKSVAVKFDTVNNDGEGWNSTGLYINGASPSLPARTLGNGVNLQSGDPFKVHVSYDGTALTMTITDLLNTSQTFTTSWPIDIPATVGGNKAYLGFTGATGASVANQDISQWTFNDSTPASKTALVYASRNLPAVSSGPTFRTFTYPGFPDSTGTILDATAPQDNVTFSVNVTTPGKYDIQLSYKQTFNRGISQLTINGTPVGAPLDQYLLEEALATVDYGDFTFPAAGSYPFKFTILGKNASSTAYPVSFDDFVLTPQ